MEERRISAGGGEITYLAAGDKDNPIILYIHGNLGCRLWYREVMNVPGYRTLAPDMPNFSESSPTGDFSMAGYARSLEAFMEAVEGGHPRRGVTIVGHSLGGVVAMELAARAELPIEKMLLVSPGPIEGLVTPKEQYPVLETYRTNRNLLKTALATVVPTLDDVDVLEELVDEGMRMHPGAFLGHPDALTKADYTDRLGKLPFPSMIIRGNADRLITQEMCTRTAWHLGAVYRELYGVGHSPMVEAPGLFLSVLKDFVG